MSFFRVHDYRAFRTVQAALQTAAAVVSTTTWLVVGTGILCSVIVERIYARPC